MAKQLDAPVNEKAAPQQGGSVPEQDVEIAVRLGVKLLSSGGLDQIKAAIDQSKDPAQVIGTFIVQMIGHMAEQLRSQVGIDPRVFLAKGAFLDSILDYIETKLGYPPEFSDQIYSQVLETIKAAAMKPPAPNNVMGEQA